MHDAEQLIADLERALAARGAMLAERDAENARFAAEVKRLAELVAALREQLDRDSSNSSKPPSSVVFEYWHDYKDGKLTRETFLAWMTPVREQVQAALDGGSRRHQGPVGLLRRHPGAQGGAVDLCRAR